MKSFLRYWLPVVAYIGAILGCSLLLRPPLGQGLLRFDKLIHVVEYAILALLAARAWRSGRRRPWWSVGGGALLLTAIFGLLDEYLQHFNNTRSPDILDALADVAGGLTGATLYLIATWWKRRGSFD